MENKIKLLLLDADGVTVLGEMKFSQKLEVDYGLTREKTSDFFKFDFNDCLIGKKDMAVCLPPYLKKWGLPHTFSELMAYWFSLENMPNKELLDHVAELRKKGIICCLATNQEKYRTEFILNKMGFAKYFDHVYSSCAMGVKKPDIAFFAQIMKDFPLINKKEVLFWDDQLGNIQSAKEFGILGELYTGYFDYSVKMARYLA